MGWGGGGKGVQQPCIILDKPEPPTGAFQICDGPELWGEGGRA